jgi:hypothetical protein
MAVQEDHAAVHPQQQGAIPARVLHRSAEQEQEERRVTEGDETE